MVAEYVRFYGGTPSGVLDLFARTFFAMLNAMYQIKADEMMSGIMVGATAQAGDKAGGVIDKLKTQSKGLSGILDEVKVVKK